MKVKNGLKVYSQEETETILEVKKIRDLDVISHPAFKTEVIKVVEEIIKQRNERPAPPEGRRYRRNWIDQLITSNQFNSDFFLDNALSALMRQSPLPAALRQPVLDVALTAFFATKEIIEKENEKQENTQSNS